MKTDSSFLEIPIDSLGSLFRERVYPLLASGASLALLLWYLCKPLLLINEQNSILQYVILTAIGFAVVSLRLLPEKKPPELRLLLQNACWVLLSRVFLGELNCTINSENYWAVLFFCLFGVGIVLKKRQRDVFLTAVTVVLCSILLAWAIAAIMTVWKGSHLEVFTRLTGGIQLWPERQITSVLFFRIHRNTTGIYFLMPMCLMIYQCVQHRNWGWYIAAGVTIPLWYAVIALQHSRSAYLATAVCLSMFLGHAALRILRKRSLTAGILAAAAVTAVFAVLLYAGFSSCGNLIARYSHAPQDDVFFTGSPSSTAAGSENATADPVKLSSLTADRNVFHYLSMEGPIESVSSTMSIYDSRDTFDDAQNLTNRTLVWKAIVPLLLRSKRLAVFGSPLSDMMKPINDQLQWKATHMHNTLLQQLLMAGIPGFLIYLLFFVSLAVRITKCYFRKSGEGREETLALGIALTGSMIYGIFEPLLCENKPVLSLVFCLLAGCFIGELSDDNESRPANK